MKAISAVIATIMLLMITVALIGVFYVFSSGLATTSTSSGSQQASQLTSKLLMCMQIINIIDNQVLLKNCGKGIIDNNSLVVLLNDIKTIANADTIKENSVGMVNVTIPGAWNMSQTNPSRKYSLKISNGATTAQALVELAQRKSNLVEYYKLDEGIGPIVEDSIKNYDRKMRLYDYDHFTLGHDFGYGVGVCSDTPTATCAKWVNGISGKAVELNGYAEAILPYNILPDFVFNSFTISTWFKTSGLFGPYQINSIVSMRGGDNDVGRYSIGMGLESHSGGGGGSVIGKMNRSDGFVYLALNSSSNGIDYDDGKWHNAVLSFDNPTLTAKLYVDGNKVNESASASSFPTINNLLAIGSSPLWLPLDGAVDEVRIYNTALTPDETIVMKQII